MIVLPPQVTLEFQYLIHKILFPSNKNTILGKLALSLCFETNLLIQKLDVDVSFSCHIIPAFELSRFREDVSGLLSNLKRVCYFLDIQFES